MKNYGKLVLIPTPIDNHSGLETTALNILLNAFNNDLEQSIFAVEELKEGRRRWLRFGLPREAIEKFVLYNEHTRGKESSSLIAKLQQGWNVYIMSDCGLPAFCDPGRELVALCHQNKITVTATPCASSVTLAVALSGFEHSRFVFEGFIPRERGDRISALKRILKEKVSSIILDTPYRLEKLLSELCEINSSRRFFIAMDLNQETEELQLGTASQLLKKLKKQKREFILLTEPLKEKK